MASSISVRLDGASTLESASSPGLSLSGDWSEFIRRCALRVWYICDVLAKRCSYEAATKLRCSSIISIWTFFSQAWFRRLSLHTFCAQWKLFAANIKGTRRCGKKSSEKKSDWPSVIFYRHKKQVVVSRMSHEPQRPARSLVLLSPRMAASQPRHIAKHPATAACTRTRTPHHTPLPPSSSQMAFCNAAHNGL